MSLKCVRPIRQSKLVVSSEDLSQKLAMNEHICTIVVDSLLPEYHIDEIFKVSRPFLRKGKPFFTQARKLRHGVMSQVNQDFVTRTGRINGYDFILV